MEITGRRNVYKIDIIALDQLFPGCLVALPSEFLGGCLHTFLITTADGFHHWLCIHIKKHGYITVGVTVRFTHEFVANQPHVDFLSHLVPPLYANISLCIIRRSYMFRFELDAGFVEHKIYNIKLPKFK